jgi:glycine cleavage system H protein
MSEVMCTKSHEYFVKEGDFLKIGITDFAAQQLGDIVFVELPEIGLVLEKGEIFGTIESVKAASELYMPVRGKIEKINEKLEEEPDLVNNDPFNEGWLIQISGFDESDFEDSLSYDEYKEFLEGGEEE